MTATKEVIKGALGESEWLPTETEGLDYALLRAHESGGATIFLRFAKGAHGAAHTHPGGEELFVVSGDISIGGKRVTAGDYLYTPPDAVHDALAHEATVLMLNLPKLPMFI